LRQNLLNHRGRHVRHSVDFHEGPRRGENDAAVARIEHGSQPGDVPAWHRHVRFETGARILRALEMASPYSWDLAERDRLVANPYSATGIRTTVIVGNRGYRGISALARARRT